MPFRYRGYVYDEETELYYLRSRYYNAEMGRFVIADTIISELGNTYSYCDNWPILSKDSTGCRPTFDAIDAYAKPPKQKPSHFEHSPITGPLISPRDRSTARKIVVVSPKYAKEIKKLIRSWGARDLSKVSAYEENGETIYLCTIGHFVSVGRKYFQEYRKETLKFKRVTADSLTWGDLISGALSLGSIALTYKSFEQGLMTHRQDYPGEFVAELADKASYLQSSYLDRPIFTFSWFEVLND